MTTREELWQAVSDALPKGCFLEYAHRQSGTKSHGDRVLAARCLQNHPPHRFTLARGIACWNYWATLEEAAGDLGVAA